MRGVGTEPAAQPGPQASRLRDSRLLLGGALAGGAAATLGASFPGSLGSKAGRSRGPTIGGALWEACPCPARSDRGRWWLPLGRMLR